MTERRLPDPAQARASLDAIVESRRAAVRAARRPAGLDLALAVVVGAIATLGLLGQWVAVLVVVIVGLVPTVIVQHRVVRRRGQVLDQRALGARAWRFAAVYLVLALLTILDPPAAWQPWFAIGVGILAAAGGYAWLRWEARYQDRRLANGDYERYDLL